MLNVMRIAAVPAVLAICAVVSAGGGKTRFSATGSYVEGCSCAAPCKCELTGVEMGCQGVGVFNLTGGSFGGKSLAGIRTAYATQPGQWVVIFIDAPNAAKRKTGEAFMRAALSGFGKIESVKNAKIMLSSNGFSDRATVDGGKVMKLTTTPIMGGDGKSPLMYSNIHDPLHPTVMQAKVSTCSYNDGTHSFDLKDTNAYFNHHINSRGSM